MTAAVIPAAVTPATLRPGQALGRFTLISLLGQGGQATVWRALDQRLQREVAIKLMAPSVDQGQGDRWLHEAQSVGRLAHPNIVPVFEADLIDGRPALVFELVEGPTLAQRLREQGAMPVRDAVELMLGVVDALRAAHGQGVVHRDLKPSNILLGADGRARVMDFGIAARWTDLNAGHDGLIAGSPGYLSPEAAAALPPSPQMDVFAAGLVLAELITGRPVLGETDAVRAVARVLNEDLQLPVDAPVDDVLRGVLQRAIARDPVVRYDSAATLRDALMQWLAPPDEALPEGGTGHAALDFLLRRMRYKSDFPAMSDGVLRIQRLANSDNETLQTLSDEILKDVALTQKLLRLVNTAHFKRSGHSVSTVSRAVALVGLAGIRNLALSLVLVEHMKDKVQADRLKQAFLRALLAGQLAQALSGRGRDAEEGFLAALFYNLGPLLAEYYFPDEAQTVQAQVAQVTQEAERQKRPLPHPDVLADQVAVQVLGMGYEALGVGVAQHWGLSEDLQHCMRRPDTPPPGYHLKAGAERQRWLSVAANEVAEALWSAPADLLPQHLESAVHRHGRALGLALPDLRRACDDAEALLAEMAPAMGLGPTLLRRQSPQVAGRSEAPTLTDAALLPLAADAATQAIDVGAVLTAGIQDITDTLAGDSPQLADVLRMVMETVFRALSCERVVFCLRETGGLRLQGRFGVGAQSVQLAKLFQVPIKPVPGGRPNLFMAVCQKGVDTLIADRHAPAIDAALPDWYRQRVPSTSFLLLPLQLRNEPFALIYADRGTTLRLSDRERALLRTLRNQALMAFKQAGHH